MDCASLFWASLDLPQQVNICYNLPDGQVVEKLFQLLRHRNFCLF